MTISERTVAGLRLFFRAIRHRTGHVASYAARLNRLVAYGFDLVLWSNLIASRRSPVPLELSRRLLETKAIGQLPPVLFVSGAPAQTGHWIEGFAAVNAGLFLNLQNPDELSYHRYAHPAPSFRGIYLWDSAFIAQIWKWWEPQVAFDVLRSVVALRDGDRLQHFVADFAESKFTQPPLLAWSLFELSKAVPAATATPWLEELYRPLCAYYDWLTRHRRLPNGLYYWAHPYESGVENAPRFSSRDERRLDPTRELAAPDLSAYMVLKCEALAGMARRLGRAHEADRFDRDAAELRQAMNTHLWDEQAGLYFDLNTATGELVRLKTIASLMPLWAGVPDRARAERLRAQIVDPRAFNTLIPLPTVARDDARFEKDMWRGPVWLNTAYAVLLGLRRYGYAAEAADLAFRLCDGVYRTFDRTRRVHEFYDPDAHHVEDLYRKRGNRWKRLTLGERPVSEFVGWSGLVNTLVADVLFGLRRGAGGLSLRPCFPPAAVGRMFSLSLPIEQRTLEIDVLSVDRARVTARGGMGVTRAEIAMDDAIDLAGPAAGAITPSTATREAKHEDL